jgi:hypothetical protein
MNSALNPFFYTITGNNFQKKLLFCKNAQKRNYSKPSYSNHNNGCETTSLTQNSRGSNNKVSTKTTRVWIKYLFKKYTISILRSLSSYLNILKALSKFDVLLFNFNFF